MAAVTPAGDLPALDDSAHYRAAKSWKQVKHTVHVGAVLRAGRAKTLAEQQQAHLDGIRKGYRKPRQNVASASVLRHRPQDHASRSTTLISRSKNLVRAHSAFSSGRKLVHSSLPSSTEAAVAATRVKNGLQKAGHMVQEAGGQIAQEAGKRLKRGLSPSDSFRNIKDGEHLHSSDVSRTINFGKRAESWRQGAEGGTSDQKEAIGWMTKGEGVTEHHAGHGRLTPRRGSILAHAQHAKAKVWRAYMRLPVLSPMTQTRRAWDVLIALAVLFYVFIMPWQLCVEWWPYSNVKNVFYVLDFVFWIDMVLNFCTGFVHHGDLVMDRKEIFEHYMQKWFWVDLVANFPFEAAFSGFSKSERKSVKLLKWFKLGTLLRAGRLMKYLNQYLSFPKLPMVLAVFIVITHTLTCAWVGVFWSANKQQQMGTAMTHFNMYLASLECTLQRLVGTSTTHAFEKSESFYVHPNSDTRIFAIVSFFIGICFLSWFIGYTSAVLTHSTDVYHKWHAKLKQMDQMVDYHQLPHEMASRLHMQAQYAYRNKIVSQVNELQHDETLNMNLRRQVALFIHRQLLEQSSLCACCSLDCLAEVALHVRVSVYFPGDVVMFQGERGKEMYFIKKGELRVLIKTGTEEDCDDKEVATMTPGQSFGEISLVADGVTTATIEAKTIVELLALSKSSCDKICQSYPSFRQMMKDAAGERLKADVSRATSTTAAGAETEI